MNTPSQPSPLSPEDSPPAPASDLAPAARDIAEALDAATLDLCALTDAAPGVSVLIDREGRILVLNRAGAERFGVGQQAAIGTNLFSYFPAEVAESRRQRLQRLLEDGQPLVFEDERAGLCYRNSAVPVVDRDGEIRRIAVFSEDITERWTAERRLRDSEARYRFIAENTEDVVWQLDTDMRFVFISSADERMRGVPREQVVGRPVTEVFGQRGRAILAEATERRRQQEARGEEVSASFRFEAPQLRHDGTEVWTEVVSTRVYDEAGRLTGYIGVSRNIEARRRYQSTLEDVNRRLRAQLEEISALQAELKDKAVRDPLTGLYNRHYLHETLPRELARARREAYPLAMVMVDLDYFKAINDTYGHVTGDQAITQAARVLQKLARESDLVCRYGGEEFLAVLPRMALDEALQRAERWRDAISQATLHKFGTEIRLTASFGVAVFPEHATGGEALLQCADAALYGSKDHGRNRVKAYQPGMAAG